MLGKQGLPFRVHDETAQSLNKGSFLECMGLLQQFGPFFLQHYTPPSNSTYLSPVSQNKTIECCSRSDSNFNQRNPQVKNVCHYGRWGQRWTLWTVSNLCEVCNWGTSLREIPVPDRAKKFWCQVNNRSIREEFTRRNCLIEVSCSDKRWGSSDEWSSWRCSVSFQGEAPWDYICSLSCPWVESRLVPHLQRDYWGHRVL